MLDGMSERFMGTPPPSSLRPACVDRVRVVEEAVPVETHRDGRLLLAVAVPGTLGNGVPAKAAGSEAADQSAAPHRVGTRTAQTYCDRRQSLASFWIWSYEFVDSNADLGEKNSESDRGGDGAREAEFCEEGGVEAGDCGDSVAGDADDE
jgi:hypothetical protein